MINNKCDLDIIVIHHHGQILNTKETIGLKRHKLAIELIFYGDNVPNIDDEEYLKILARLKRETDDQPFS